jgi:hypothetical protein
MPGNNTLATFIGTGGRLRTGIRGRNHRNPQGSEAMIKEYLAIAGLVLGCCTAFAASAAAQGTVNFMDGNKLLEYCNTNERAYSWFCSGYIQGASDQLAMRAVASNQPICFGSDVEGDQVRDVVVRYLTAHPENRVVAAGGLIKAAIEEAWRCAAKERQPSRPRKGD